MRVYGKLNEGYRFISDAPTTSVFYLQGLLEALLDTCMSEITNREFRLYISPNW